MSAPDRLEKLLQQDAVTGIDFVYVHPSQIVLDVFFLRNPATLATPLVNDLLASQLRIYSPSGGETLPNVTVAAVSWTVVDGRDVLRIATTLPGDFSRYRLLIDDARIDPYFNDVAFSFKANCPTELDCKESAAECPIEPPVDFPVNYLARDFWSFRRALLDFASERYPDWKDRLEADAGVMLAELMSAAGDELAYYQDRAGREAYLETASQRRSIRRHARLVDYHMHDGLGASTWLDFTVAAGQFGNIPAGAQVWEVGTQSDESDAKKRREGSRIVYEAGRGLADRGLSFAVHSARNEFLPHLWDEDDLCLPAGSTTLYIDGHHQANLTFDDFSDPARPGKWVLLKTTPTIASIAARAHMVRLVEIADTIDPVFNQNITRLVWDVAQATPFELDLAALVVRGNLVPATAGETIKAQFLIGPQASDDDPPEAVERAGPSGSVAYLFSLPGSDNSGLVWLGPRPQEARPEIRLFEVTKVGSSFVEGQEWSWRRSLLGVSSSQAADRDFTLDDGVWRRVVGYQRIGKEIVHVDYATGDGVTVRFGDGEFGLIPASGKMFQASYRLGNGRAGNVSAGSLTDFDKTALTIIDAVVNPLPATNGIDPETATEARQLAPEAFRAVTYRAVRPEDYAEAAERLAWVQRAGAAFRWTGSWITAFVTPDPRGAVTVTEDEEVELLEQLDRFRQAGREAYGLDPIYANVDLEIQICVAPSSYKGEVKQSVLEALFGKRGARGRPGFFSPDNFTFGTSLERSTLEAVIQSVEGVRAVEGMRIRRRGRFGWRPFAELVFTVADNEVIRVENDPLLPERGSLRLIMEGGA
jgi:hypothetical protein